jgi:hypothetical protein
MVDMVFDVLKAEGQVVVTEPLHKSLEAVAYSHNLISILASRNTEAVRHERGIQRLLIYFF